MIRGNDAHLAGHGAKDKAYEKVYEEFMSNLPVHTLLHHQKPSVKTLRDKFRIMLSIRKSENSKNEAASGVSEHETEEDELLDDYIHEMEELKTERKMETEKLSQAEQMLIEAGEQIQNQALSRAALKNAREDARISGSSPVVKKGKRNDDDGWECWMEKIGTVLSKQKKM